MDDLSKILLVGLIIVVGLFAFSAMGSDGGVTGSVIGNVPQYSGGGGCGR